MIEVNNLSKIYTGNKAVDNLSFKLEEGHVYGFLGPNGAGKSTTMNMLTGYLAPTSGTVTINGFDILEDPINARSCIGYLPEIPPLYPDMTVMEYMNFVAELKNIPKKEKQEAINLAIETAGIDNVKNRLIRNLSKGYKQRTGLAQAVIGLPKFIILDEPTVGLDPIQMIEMRDTIKKLAKDHTILLSSHILSEVSAICDHIMIISHGKLVASNTPAGLEKEMQGTNKLNIEVKTSKDNLKQIFDSFDNIKYKFLDSESEDFSCAEIEYSHETEIRDELFFKLAEIKAPIYDMKFSSHSLESIFIQLTENTASQDDTLNNQEDNE